MEELKLIECPRDAWQGLPRQIPTEMKVRYLRGLIAAGFRHIDAVSFVSPKAVPQMADSEAVLAQLDLPNDAEIIGIVVNAKGAERAIATGKVTTLGYPCSISPTFLQRNQRQTPEENIAILQEIQALATAKKLNIVVYISMAFGNPYNDTWDIERVGAAVAELYSLGIHSISLADTVGVAQPRVIHQVVASAVTSYPSSGLGVHLHSTREEAGEKILAAYDAGCRRFDSALGGLGGCPFAQDKMVGNIPTEKVLYSLGQRGLKPPLALTEVQSLNESIRTDFAH